MIYGMFILSLLAWFIDNVKPGEHGSKKPPYFMFTPQYWGFGDRSAPAVAIYKHNVKKLSSVLPDMDQDITREHQSAMAMAQSSSEGIIILKLSKTYEGGARALDTLTVGCEKGNVLCLLGHNGAGKSTAISVLTGLYEATSGDALLFGYSAVYEMEEIRKIMGVCPQHDILWPELTAKEHLKLFTKLKAVPDQEREIMERLSEVKLDNVADHYSSTFSGGMKRRLSVAIASIGNPKIIFLDEPTSGLDPRSRIQLAQLVQTIKKDRIVVLTTHSMEEADALGDKIAIMALGRLRAVGDSLHLKTRYGEGYHINLVCNDRQTEILKAKIKREFPRAKLRFQSAGNLMYTLPYAHHDVVAAFFGWIERDPTITDWGVSHTTLEEVFLRITHGEPSEHDAETVEVDIMLEEIDQSIGMELTQTLYDARQLIIRLPSAPPFFQFLKPSSNSPTPIPVRTTQEHLTNASSLAPAIVLRTTISEQEPEKEPVEETEKLRAELEMLRRRLGDLEKEREEKKLLVAENVELKRRILELEKLLEEARR